MPDFTMFRPALVISEASRLQGAGALLPSAESGSVRNLDERGAMIHSWIVMALLALFALFIVTIIFVLD